MRAEILEDLARGARVEDGRVSQEVEAGVLAGVLHRLPAPARPPLEGRHPSGQEEAAAGPRDSGQVDLLVPGMAEHFIARMRGLWLSYPDGSVVTAREEAATSELPGSIVSIPDATEMAPGVADPTLRRGTLEATGETAGGPPLVRPHAPLSGLRPAGEAPSVHRTDCGWIV